MSFFTKRLALLAVLLLAVAGVRAQEFEVDGIRYSVFWDTSVSIIAVSDDYKKGMSSFLRQCITTEKTIMCIKLFLVFLRIV